MHRLMLAENLVRRSEAVSTSELRHLYLERSSLSYDFLRRHGNNIETIPFGFTIDYNGSTYLIKHDRKHFDPMHSLPPSRPHMMHFDPIHSFPPPRPDMMRVDRSTSQPPGAYGDELIFKDLRPSSLWPVWTLFLLIDALILALFMIIIRKLIAINRLKNAIISFREGDKKLAIDAKGEDEISQITREFNRVLGKIDSMKEARTLFLRNILHELKTPIMKGTLIAECLESGTERTRLERIFERMNYLLDEFARMERFSSGEWELNVQEYRFVDLLDHACDILLCDRNQFIIRGEDSITIVKADFELFTIALKNILDNAIRYTTSGKPSIVIADGEIEVCNVGEGIPETNRDFTRAFNRAYESSSSGLGLGLYLTRSILEIHGFGFEYHYRNGINCFRVLLK